MNEAEMFAKAMATEVIQPLELKVSALITEIEQMKENIATLQTIVIPTTVLKTDAWVGIVDIEEDTFTHGD